MLEVIDEFSCAAPDESLQHNFGGRMARLGVRPPRTEHTAGVSVKYW
jgi:hypothetical protein